MRHGWISLVAALACGVAQAKTPTAIAVDDGPDEVRATVRQVIATGATIGEAAYKAQTECEKLSKHHDCVVVLTLEKGCAAYYPIKGHGFTQKSESGTEESLRKAIEWNFGGIPIVVLHCVPEDKAQ